MLYTMTTEEDAKQLFESVVLNARDYHLSDDEVQSFRRAEADMLQAAPGTFEDTPYRMLVRIIFATLEYKAYEMRQKIIDRLGEVPVDELPVTCIKCNVPLKYHDRSWCKNINFENAGAEEDRPGV